MGYFKRFGKPAAFKRVLVLLNRMSKAFMPPKNAATRRQSLFLTICAGLLVVEIGLGAAVYGGFLTGNLSPSAPTGLYLRAPAQTAPFVTFCLRRRHAAFGFYGRFCSPDAPEAMQILKRIAARQPGGSLSVAGLVAHSLDSSLIGPISPDQITGYWRHIGP